MADGTVFEKKGVPAAAIITRPFAVPADSMARRQGYSNYRYAVIPHPISSLSAEQIKQRAIDARPDILSILGIEEKTKRDRAAAS